MVSVCQGYSAWYLLGLLGTLSESYQGSFGDILYFRFLQSDDVVILSRFLGDVVNLSFR
jgi:hypothetical protein